MKSYPTCICITHNGKRTHILWRPVDLHVRQTRYQVVLFPANPIHLCFWLLLKDVGSRSRIYPKLFHVPSLFSFNLRCIAFNSI